MKWFRPRFSVRTLAIAVTLVCAYFGLWAYTIRNGTSDIIEVKEKPTGLSYYYPQEMIAAAPFVICVNERTEPWQQYLSGSVDIDIIE